MGRPKEARAGRFELFQEMEEFRTAHRLSTKEFAQIINMPYNSYRMKLSRAEEADDGPPRDVWRRFVSYRDVTATLRASTQVLLTEILYFDIVRQAFLPVPASVTIIRCTNPKCQGGRPHILQCPANKIYCTPLCGKRHRRAIAREKHKHAERKDSGTD